MAVPLKPAMKKSLGKTGSNPAPILADAGDFHLLETFDRSRLIVSVEALQRGGKTHFALTAPGPIWGHAFDVGFEEIAQKFLRTHKKEIHIANYTLNVPRKDSNVEKIMEAVRPVWDKFMDNYYRSLEQARTVIIDTASEQWEVLRMARFGKMTQVMPHHYGPVNAEYRQLIKDAYNYNANLVLLHKMKAEWAEGGDGKGRKTGAYERAGFSGVGFEVQAELQAWGEQGENGGTTHHVTVINSRQNPMVDGMNFTEPECEFADIAVMINPDSSRSDWE